MKTKIISYVDGLDLSACDGCIVRNVPCYLSDAVDELVSSTLAGDIQDKFIEGERFVVDTLRVGTTYIVSGCYLDDDGMIRRKARGRSRSYYFATSEMESFVKDKELFSLLRGDIKRRVKRYKKHLLVSVSPPSHNWHTAHWPTQPHHIKCVVVQK